MEFKVDYATLPPATLGFLLIWRGSVFSFFSFFSCSDFFNEIASPPSFHFQKRYTRCLVIIRICSILFLTKCELIVSANLERRS